MTAAANTGGAGGGAVGAPLSREIAEAAADWLLRLSADEATESDRAEWQTWRRQDPSHERAWQRLEGMGLRMKALPPKVAMAALDRPVSPARRRVVGQLAVLLTVGAAGLAVHRQGPAWMSDHHTGRGERRTLALPDGSHVQLNALTAIDLAFDDTLRRVRLIEGEVLIQTAPDPAAVARPFVVDTAQGRVVALGTRFTVRQDEHSSLVSVHAHAVEVRTGAQAPRRLDAGQAARFGRDGVEVPTAVDPNAEAWTRGLLYADRMPLSELARTLSRHRPGILRCDSAVAAMQVSGAFPLDRPDEALALLERTLPLRIERRFGLWTVLVSSAEP